MFEFSDKTKNILGLLAAAVLFVSIKYWEQALPIWVIFVILVGFIFFIKNVFKKSYKESINIVDKQFVYNRNTIRNKHCVVKYTPGVSVVVSENAASRQMRDIRTFTLNSKNVQDVDRCWNDICKFYSDVTYFDTLVSFFQQDNVYLDIVLVPLSVKPAEAPKVERKQPEKVVVDFDEVQIDKSNIIKDLQVSEGVLDLNNIDSEKAAKIESVFTNYGLNEDIANDSGYFDMDALVAQAKARNAHKKQEEFDPNLVYINYATAEQIATLPGVNIVGAKKVVAFRDRVRLFNSIEDFIEIACIPEQFTSQIAEKISLKRPKENGDADSNFGRIIDL